MNASVYRLSLTLNIVSAVAVTLSAEWLAAMFALACVYYLMEIGDMRKKSDQWGEA